MIESIVEIELERYPRPVTSLPVRIGTLAVVVAAIGAFGLVRCYSATEVILDLRTDIACETFRPETQVRLGDGRIVATTRTCDTPAAATDDRAIGTLVFVPSADREAQVVIEVALAVNGLRPEQCATQPDKCIVARRSFSFIEHSSRRLQVLLRGQCLGKVCQPNETCVESGACVPLAAACQLEGCGTEPAPPPSTTPPIPILDGGSPSTCTSGEIRCVDSRLDECREGRYEVVAVCDSPDLCRLRTGIRCATGAPGNCRPKDRRCEGKDIVRCEDDASRFVTEQTCPIACAEVAGEPRCTICTPTTTQCDYACEQARAAGPAPTTANDCLARCGLDGTWAYEDCGIAQHGTFSDSCRMIAGGGAECFQ